MVCEKCGGCVTWRGPLSCLTHTQCESCGGITCQIAEYDCLEEDCPVPAEPVNARLLDALKLAECVYRKNVVNEGEPSSVLEAMQAAITAAEAHRPTDYSSTVDRAWARFCGAFGDGPDAPYPGMIAAFETHYGQSFRDAAWRTEAACWAAAWHKATEQASRIKPPSTDE